PLPVCGCQFVWKANLERAEELQGVGTQLMAEDTEHSYMHCWRHKTPVIYRATSQWFAGMDRDNSTGRTLREMALEAVENTRFYPSWGKARLHSMIANRPDWTLSRQRQWGVPMGIFLHKETGELHPDTPELLEKVADLIEAHGIDIWLDIKAVDIIGEYAMN